MLDQNDISMLKSMMESVVDERLEKSEENILKKVDERLEKSENMMLDEIERTRGILEDKIEKIQKNMDELNNYYHIHKLENDNTALLLKLIDSLSKRVEELERRTA